MLESPIKSGMFEAQRRGNKADSDPRLQPNLLGIRRKDSRVSVKVSVAVVLGYNPRQPRSLLADELGSGWFMFTT
jgi:hypothetical protein